MKFGLRNVRPSGLPHWSEMRLAYGRTRANVSSFAVDYLHYLPDRLGMMGNDSAGDCFVAAQYHGRQLRTLMTPGTFGTEPDATVLGALGAEGGIAEVALFAASKRVFARMTPLSLLAVAAAAGVARWTVLGSTTALPALIAVQGLHAFTFGATHLAAMHQIARTVPAAHGATAQSFYSSFAGGLSMAAAMLVSGWLYAGFGGLAFFAMAGVSLAGGLAIVALVRATGSRSARSA